jgi:hypothetical protein
MKSSSKAIKNACQVAFSKACKVVSSYTLKEISKQECSDGLYEIRTNIAGLYQKADTKTAKGYIDTVVEYCDEHIQKLSKEA